MGRQPLYFARPQTAFAKKGTVPLSIELKTVDASWIDQNPGYDSFVLHYCTELMKMIALVLNLKVR